MKIFDDIFDDLVFKFPIIEHSDVTKALFAYPITPTSFMLGDWTVTDVCDTRYFTQQIAIDQSVKSSHDIDNLIYTEILKMAPVVLCQSDKPEDIIGTAVESMLAGGLDESELQKGVCLYSDSEKFRMPNCMHIVALNQDPNGMHLYWTGKEGGVKVRPYITPWNAEHQFETRRIIIVRVI